MRFHFTPLLAAGALALASTLLASNDARACGGCFHIQSETESTVVTGHRMAFALSPTHTVLWDQVQYAGNPAEFAWVLPVKPGARVEVSTNAWFEALDAATSARVVSPTLDCPGTGSPSSGCGLGCSSALSAGGDGNSLVPVVPPVTVVHEGAVGPYETVTLHANVPGALPQWLTSHGFAIDAAIQPVVDAYSKEGFDFIALRLLPGKGIQQMQPVRVVSPGLSPTLPLRMVAAGTGANVDITLFVISEGAWGPQNFPSSSIATSELTWDFNTSSSNYAEKRKALLAGAGGTTWNHAYSTKGALLSALPNPVLGGNMTYEVDGVSPAPETIADAYIQQGLKNGEGVDSFCTQAFANAAASLDVVVNPCGPSGGGGGGGGAGGSGGVGGSGGSGGSATSCTTVGPGEIDARQLACGKLDDVAVALEGLHPLDVTVTRLEASLPRAALATDLVLKALELQGDVSNWFSVEKTTNEPKCPAGAPPVVGGDSGRKGPWNRNRWALYATMLAALLATFGRRATRPTLTARAH